MKHMEDLKEMLCDELDEIAEKGKVNAGDLDAIDKLTHSIKSIETIMAMGEYSNDYMSAGRSYANRDSDGRYSRNSYARNGGNSRGYSRRGGYSRNGYSYGRDEMVEELRELMEDAETEKEREAIRRCIEQM